MKKKIITSLLFALFLCSVAPICAMKKKIRMPEIRKSWKKKGLLKQYKNFWSNFRNAQFYFEDDNAFLYKPENKKIINSLGIQEHGMKISKPLNILLSLFDFVLNHKHWRNAVIYLIKNGADINYKDQDGKTPLEYIIKSLSEQDLTGEIFLISDGRIKRKLEILYALIKKKPKFTNDMRKRFGKLSFNIKKYYNVQVEQNTKKYHKLAKDVKAKMSKLEPLKKVFLNEESTKKQKDLAKVSMETILHEIEFLNKEQKEIYKKLEKIEDILKKLKKINKFFKGEKEISQKDFGTRIEFLLSQE